MFVCRLTIRVIGLDFSRSWVLICEINRVMNVDRARDIEAIVEMTAQRTSSGTSSRRHDRALGMV